MVGAAGWADPSSVSRFGASTVMSSRFQKIVTASVLQ
jgi:hypothetical protein